MSEIPVIDLAPYYRGAEANKREVARRIDVACRETGFFTITGHGVPDALIQDVFGEAFGFFRLPVEEKRRYLPPSDTVLRGYLAMATNRLAKSRGEDTPPDLREGFFLGRPGLTGQEKAAEPDAQPFYRACIWPDRPAGFRATYTRYYAEMERLATDLMRLFALALGLEERFFDDKIDDHFAVLNLFHYPRQLEAPAPGQLRAGAHSDFGSVTILLQMPSAGGLEVMDSRGNWQLLPPRPGAFAINIGDLMAQWTNDRWRSTLHRVVNPPGEAATADDRVSVGFFCHPNFDARIDTVATCRGADGSTPYAPISAGDYMRRKIFAVRGIPLPPATRALETTP